MIQKSTKLFNIDKLICVIIKCAVNDYQAELRKKVRFHGKGQHVNSSIEYFFRSKHFRSLTELNGEDVIKAIKEKEASRKRKTKDGK